MATALIDGSRAEEGVVEDGVGDQTTGVIGEAGAICLQWVASAATDGVVAQEMALELISVERLDISPVVLVEVGETVVEVDRRANVVWDVELQGTDGGPNVDRTIGWSHHLHFSSP